MLAALLLAADGASNASTANDTAVNETKAVAQVGSFSWQLGALLGLGADDGALGAAFALTVLGVAAARARRRAALAALHYYAQHAPLVAAKGIRERRKHGQALRRQKCNDSIY